MSNWFCFIFQGTDYVDKLLKNHTVKTTLRVAKPTESQIGNYTLIATNVVGTTSETFSVSLVFPASTLGPVGGACTPYGYGRTFLIVFVFMHLLINTDIVSTIT